MDPDDLEPEVAAAKGFYDEQNNRRNPPYAGLGGDYVHIDVDVISGDALLDEDCALADVLLPKGRVITGCSEMDDTLLRAGFERGSVVGISAEREDFALLVGLQTIANMLVTEAEGSDKPSSAMIITTMATEQLLPTLKGVIQGQAEAQSAVGDVKARVQAALKRITISRVFDYDGLRESLDELYLPGEHPLLTASTSSPSTPDSTHNVATGPIAGDQSPPSNRGFPQPSGVDIIFHQGYEQQQTVINEERQDNGQHLKPDVILVANMPALLVSLYGSRDGESAETALRNLRRRLRYITRSVAHRGPLIMLLSSAETVVSYPDEEQFPEMGETYEVEAGNRTAEAGMSEGVDDEPGGGTAEAAQTIHGAAHVRDLPAVLLPASQDAGLARSPEAGVSPTEPPVTSDPISPSTTSQRLLKDLDIGILDASHMPQLGFEPRLASILQRPPYPPRNIEFTTDGSCIVRPQKASDMLQLWSKPFYGLEFGELLDLHLLCFQLQRDGQAEVGGQEEIGNTRTDGVIGQGTEGNLAVGDENCRDKRDATGVEEASFKKQNGMIDPLEQETYCVRVESDAVDRAGYKPMLAKRDADLRDTATNEKPVRRDDLVWMVEVLHDKYGVWDEDKDAWVTRDERWCALDVEKVDNGAIRLVRANSKQDTVEFMSDKSAGLGHPYQEEDDDPGESPEEAAGLGSLNSSALESHEDEPAEHDGRNIHLYNEVEPKQSGRDWYDGNAGENEQAEDGLGYRGDIDVERQLEYDTAITEGHDRNSFWKGDDNSVEEGGTISQASSEEEFAYQGCRIPGFLQKGPCGIRVPLQLLEVDTKTHAPWAPDPDLLASGLPINRTQRLWELDLCGPNLEATSRDVVADNHSSDEGAVKHGPDGVLLHGYHEYMRVVNGHHRKGHVVAYEEFVAEAISCRLEEYDLGDSPDLLDRTRDIHSVEGSEDGNHGDHEEADVGVQNAALRDEADFTKHFWPMAGTSSSKDDTVSQREARDNESQEAVLEQLPVPENRTKGARVGPDSARMPDVAEEESHEEMELIEVKRSAAEYQDRQQSPETVGDGAESTVCPIEVSEQGWQECVYSLMKVVDGDYAAGYRVLTQVLRLINGEEEGRSYEDDPELMQEDEDEELRAHWEKCLSIMDHARYTPDAMTSEEYLRFIHTLLDDDERLSVEDAAYGDEVTHDGHEAWLAEDEGLSPTGVLSEDDPAQREDTDDNCISLAAEYTAYMTLMEDVGCPEEAMSYREFYGDICGHSLSHASCSSSYTKAHPTNDPVAHDETILDKWRVAWADYFVQMDQAGLAAEAMNLDEYIARVTPSMED